MRRQGSIHRSFEARAPRADATLYAHCWFLRDAPPALPKGFSPSRVKLALDGGARTAVARADGGFQFSDVLPGVYLLEATAVGYSFPQLRVDVSAKHKSVRWARVAAGGARRWPAPVVVAAEAPLDYYEKEDGGGLMKMVMSPMGLMAVFMCVMAFVMPRMLEGIDPEELKKMQKEMQAQQKDNPLNKLMGQ